MLVKRAPVLYMNIKEVIAKSQKFTQILICLHTLPRTFDLFANLPFPSETVLSQCYTDLFQVFGDASYPYLY